MNEIERTRELLDKARSEIAKVIIGQQRVIDFALISIMSRSHALVEGVPGIAKTLLVRTLGKVMRCETRRIQFTPDLMPADITGTNSFNLKDNQFVLFKGPVFTSFLLADEINRAPAKTQSALLQAMQERQVSIDNTTHPLPYSFTVFATQNPIEFEGTYPLPEAQKDRFLLKIDMGYPSEEEEALLASRMLGGESPEAILDSGAVQEVFPPDELPRMQESFRGVTVKQDLIDYMVKVVRTTRRHSAVLVGAGPRATQAFLLATRVHAMLEGRDFVSPDDVKELAAPILGHRLVLRPEFEIEGLSIPEVVSQILEEIPVPR
ncbi:MAG: MoxR family ATPase [Victivallales bacterium]|nr:MoxR family ATPase [Victivallales bacterium]